MKVLVGFMIFSYLVATVVTVSEEGIKILREKRDKAITECKKELKDVSDYDFGVIQRRGESENEVQNCVFECLYTKLGLLKNGKLDHEEFINAQKIRHGDNQTAINEEEKIYQKCESEVAKNSAEKCGAAKALAHCIRAAYASVIEKIVEHKH